MTFKKRIRRVNYKQSTCLSCEWVRDVYMILIVRSSTSTSPPLVASRSALSQPNVAHNKHRVFPVPVGDWSRALSLFLRALITYKGLGCIHIISLYLLPCTFSEQDRARMGSIYQYHQFWLHVEISSWHLWVTDSDQNDLNMNFLLSSGSILDSFTSSPRELLRLYCPITCFKDFAAICSSVRIVRGLLFWLSSYCMFIVYCNKTSQNWLLECVSYC